MRLLVAFILPLWATCAMAQFQFFENMFGGQQHQNFHQQQHRPASDGSQWMAQAEHTSCSHYQCPTTLACVNKPSECPCPNVEDIKCTIPDWDDEDSATVICARGEKECAEIERLAKVL